MKLQICSVTPARRSDWISMTWTYPDGTAGRAHGKS
jgi:hypothetical protein